MSETRICECGGTMHHSDDMENPFDSPTGDCKPFFQCEDCGEIVNENGESEAEPDTDTDKATARPWSVNHIGEGVYRREALFDDNHGQIAEMIDAGNGAANAALIVRAVNSHDGLVEACERLVAHVEKLDHMYEAKMQESCGTVEIALQARAALAEAKP